MFSPSAPLKSLSPFCRSLATLFETGVSAQKAFKVAGGKAASPVIRQATAGILEELQKGEDVASAMALQNVFPELMINMTVVGEQTGTLPEIFRGLADHYENLVRLRSDFYRSIAWPVFQLIMAIFVIAGLIYLLGMIASTQGSEPLDVLGWGLTGTTGALIWLGYCFGSAFTAYLVYRFLKASLIGQKYMDGFLLRIPVLGHCMRSFSIARFAWAYHLTQEAGMPVDDSISYSMQATNNGAFIGAGPQIIYQLQAGDTVTEALKDSELFPDDVIEMVHVGETTGTVPETLHRLSPHFEDQARRALQTLAGALGWLVWLTVAGFIIYVIFSIAFWYLGLVASFLP